MSGFSLTYIGIISALMLKLGLLFNGQVLNGFSLTMVGVVLGLALAFAVLVYANYASKRDMKVLPESGHVVNWYTKPFFASNMAAVALVVSLLVVSAANNMFHYSGSKEARYTVTDKGLAFFGASNSLIATLSNGESSFQVLVGQQEVIEVGDTFTVNIKRGLVGFEHVVSYIKERS